MTFVTINSSHDWLEQIFVRGRAISVQIRAGGFDGKIWASTM
jgi:hypothetical protein